MTHVSFSEFLAPLRAFIARYATLPFSPDQPNQDTDSEFNRLAMELFALQTASNTSYRLFCHARGTSLQSIHHWQNIPAIPAMAFKEFELTSLAPAERTKVFHSSGTTEHQPSRHFHNPESLQIYELSLASWFKANLPEAARKTFPMSFLTPSPAAAPHSSLVHMFESLRQRFGPPGSAFLGTVDSNRNWQIDLPALQSFLTEALRAGRQVALLGTAFNFVHLLDYLLENNLSLQLPPGSWVMETGGYKGRSRSMSKADLHALMTKQLGIPAHHIICEYGMCELSSQAYDISLAQTPSPARVFRFPPWARAQIISPETGQQVALGETGLIRILDLANVYSVMAIQTEDLGIRRAGGFELLGRAALAEARGCSLMSASVG